MDPYFDRIDVSSAGPQFIDISFPITERGRASSKVSPSSKHSMFAAI